MGLIYTAIITSTNTWGHAWAIGAQCISFLSSYTVFKPGVVLFLEIVFVYGMCACVCLLHLRLVIARSGFQRRSDSSSLLASAKTFGLRY